VAAKKLWADEEQGRTAMLARFAAGASLGTHRHAGDELVFVIEGAIGDESGPLRAGQVGYRPDGCEHTVSSGLGATALAFVTGTIAPIDALGDGPGSQVVDVASLEWQAMGEGLRVKAIWADPTGAERRLVLVRFEPGAGLAAHRHVGDELVFVLEGTVEDEFSVIEPGEMGYRPPGCTHTVSSPRGATALALITGHSDPI
jgi:anti-sigma factor ChrR (cupin superfamily)